MFLDVPIVANIGRVPDLNDLGVTGLWWVTLGWKMELRGGSSLLAVQYTLDIEERY